MAKLSAIPENLIIPLMEKYEDGLNDTELSEWLLTEHGIEASRLAVQGRLKPFRDIAQQAKRDAITSRAGDRALDYVSMIDKDIAKLDKITDLLLQSKDDMPLAKSLMETKAKLLFKQIEFTGINKEEKDQSNQEDMLQRILAKFPKLEIVEDKDKKAG